MTTKRPSFTPWDVRELPAILEPDEARRRAAILAWIEESLAEVLERWAGETDSEAATTILARHAQNSRWHVKLWRDEILGGATDAEPGDTKRIVDAVASTSPSDLVEALTATHRVLIPRLISAYTYHQRALNVHEDAATHRWVPFMIKDLLEAVRDGELLLQSLLTDTASVERSARTRAALETTIVQTGGLVGPTTLGDFSEQKEVPIR